jgi:hypothetical protein
MYSGKIAVPPGGVGIRKYKYLRPQPDSNNKNDINDFSTAMPFSFCLHVV